MNTVKIRDKISHYLDNADEIVYCNWYMESKVERNS